MGLYYHLSSEYYSMFERTPLSNIPHTLLQLKWIWLTNALLRGTCPQNTNDICPLCKAIDQLCGTHIKLASARPFPWAKRCRKKRREIYESWFQTSWWETFLWNSWHWKKRSQDLRYGAQFNAPQKEKHAFFSMWIITWFQCGGLLVDFRFKTFTTRWKTSPVVGVFKNPRCIPKKTWIPPWKFNIALEFCHPKTKGSSSNHQCFRGYVKLRGCFPFVLWIYEYSFSIILVQWKMA